MPVPTPAAPAKPFLRPSVPPPGHSEQIDLPGDGAWVRIISADGSFLGRVIFSEPSRIRLKEGAGFWDINTRTILSVSALPEPVAGDDCATRAAREKRRQERTLQRVLDRWP